MPKDPQLSTDPAAEPDAKVIKGRNGKPPSQPNPWIEALQTIGLSVVLALGIRQFVAEARYIPSGSMEPTLLVRDRLVVEKVSYYFNDPARGDVVVFWPPMEASPTGQRDAFIKRIIGLPGDTVEIVNQQVIVNGSVLQEDYIKAAPEENWGPETVPEGMFLMLGDNRNSSYDGRAWGFVAREDIIGRAAFRFWPPNRIGGID